jgi:hypothetical protein
MNTNSWRPNSACRRINATPKGVSDPNMSTRIVDAQPIGNYCPVIKRIL